MAALLQRKKTALACAHRHLQLGCSSRAGAWNRSLASRNARSACCSAAGGSALSRSEPRGKPIHIRQDQWPQNPRADCPIRSNMRSLLMCYEACKVSVPLPVYRLSLAFSRTTSLLPPSPRSRSRRLRQVHPSAPRLVRPSGVSSRNSRSMSLASSSTDNHILLNHTLPHLTLPDILRPRLWHPPFTRPRPCLRVSLPRHHPRGTRLKTRLYTSGRNATTSRSSFLSRPRSQP
ncbi:hypothetical protein C8Q70DRAFT_602828 [Cubamyces menziesii]|nr:hypothetical protein C8Q70DRAFT_602828 [Cubamyces menziesii]